jgi:uncharacterized membrane protein YphA (DoxX/SURF4 family)
VFEAYCKDKLAPLTLRLGLGSLGVWHGFLKITANGGMTWHPGLAVGWQLLIAWGELAAGLAILVGLRCRLAALLLVGISAAVLIEWHRWAILHLPSRTLEPALLLLFAGLALALLGAGELSLDARSGSAKPSGGRATRLRKAA